MGRWESSIYIRKIRRVYPAVKRVGELSELSTINNGCTPNDEFEEDQYCHSPWFEKCCGEQRTVGELKKRGDWDDIWFQMRPRKTINFPVPPTAETPLTPAPTQV